MSHRYPLLLLALCASLVASAQAVVEKFNYAAGAMLTGQTGGTGFSGPWQALSGNGGYVIAEGGIQAAGVRSQTSGTHVMIDKAAGTDVRYVRPLTTAFADNAGEMVYLSSFQRHEGGGGSYVLFANSSFGAGGPGGQLSMTGQNPGQATFGHSRPPQTNANTSVASADGSFVVTAIRFNGAGVNEAIFIWVNPALDRVPDTTKADLVVRNLALDAGFNAIGLKATGGAVMSMIDEVRLSKVYAEVVPDDLRPFTPTAAGGFAFDQFKYGIGDSLSGEDGGQGWNGPWRTVSAKAQSTIIPGGLSNDELNVATSGPAVEMRTIGENSRIQRLFANPIVPADGDFWFSIHMSAYGNLNTVATVNLVDTSIASDRDKQQLFVGRQFGNRQIFAAGFGGPSGASSTGQTFEGSGAEWIVSKVVRNVDSSRWELFVWVNPDPAAATLDTATAQIKRKPYMTTKFNGVWLKSEANNGAVARFDDLLFGRSYADVIAPDLTPIPAAGTGAEEGFDYAAGTALEGLAGGRGWGGPWDVLTEAPGMAMIADGGVTSFGVLRRTAAGHAVINNARVVRPLNTEYGDFGRTYWVGWWTQSEGTVTGNVANLVLASDAYAAGGPAGQLVQIGKGFGADDIGFSGGPSVPNVLATEGHFLVAEIVTNGVAANDEIYLWVDPDLQTQPSRDSATRHTANLSGWSAIGFKVEGNANVTARFDDVYVGRSFTEVVPTDLTDVLPPNIPIPAVETFAYAAGTPIAGKDGGEGWAEPWMGDGTVTDGSLKSPRVKDEGNRLTLTAASNTRTATRNFFAPFGEQAGPVWVSFLMQMPLKDLGTFGRVGLALDGVNVISIGGEPGTANLAIRYAGGPTNPSSNASVKVTDLHWYVMRLDLTADGTIDTAYVWVDPPADALPTDASAIFSPKNLTADLRFNEVLATAGGVVGNATMNVDEFRIGFSYRDISTNFGSSDPNLIAYEPFNYDPGTSLLGSGGINAFWDGPWVAGPQAGSLDVNKANVIAGSIPGAPAPEGNRVEYQLNDGATANRIRIQRPLAEKFSIEGGGYWLAFAMNTTSPDVFRNVGQVILTSSGGPGAQGQLIGIGRGFAEAAGPLGITLPGANPGFIASLDGAVDDQGAKLLVMQAIPAPDDADGDYFAFWVDPPTNVTPDTSTAGVIIQRTRTRGATIDGVMIKVEAAGGMPGYVTQFDEVRIGRQFGTVVGMTVGAEEVSGPSISVNAFPNPVTNELSLVWETERPGQALVQVYDQSGRIIATPFAGQTQAGEQRVTWTVDAGASAGVYFVRVMQDGSVSTRRVILHR